MDIAIVDPQGNKVEKPNEPIVSEHNATFPVLPEIQVGAVGEAMGLEGRELIKYRDDIDTIIDYLRTKSTNLSPANIRFLIRELEIKLGAPPVSEKRIKFVSRYAYLLTEKRKLDGELKQFET